MIKNYKSLICEKRGPKKEVLWVTLNNEKMVKPLSNDMRQEFLNVLENVLCNNEIKCVVFKKAGDNTCFGGKQIRDFMDFLNKPVITAVTEYCCTGGSL